MKWLLVIAALAALGEWWSRRAAKRGARNLLATSKALYSGAHEYREVDLSRYRHVDRGFYEHTSTVLRDQGFVHLGDVEDVTTSQVGPIRPTPICVMVGDRKLTVVALYHAIVGGMLGLVFALFGKRSHKVIDVETAFADNTFIVTSTAQMAGGLDYPPEIQAEFLPPTASLETLLQRHRAKVSSKMAAGPQPIRFDTLPQVLKHQERLDELKAAFRKARGSRFTADEIARIGGKGSRRASEQLAQEMAKLE